MYVCVYVGNECVHGSQAQPNEGHLQQVHCPPLCSATVGWVVGEGGEDRGHQSGGEGLGGRQWVKREEVDEKSPRFSNLMGVIRSLEQQRLPPINSQAWKMNSRGPESDLTLIAIDLTRKFRRLMSEEAFFFLPSNGPRALPLRSRKTLQPLISLQKHQGDGSVVSEERTSPRQNTTTPPQLYFGQGFIKATLEAGAVKYKIRNAFTYQKERNLKQSLHAVTNIVFRQRTVDGMDTSDGHQ